MASYGSQLKQFLPAMGKLKDAERLVREVKEKFQGLIESEESIQDAAETGSLCGQLQIVEDLLYDVRR